MRKVFDNDCPWVHTRWSPSRREMKFLFKVVLNKLDNCDSILEFGCGNSTWYLNHHKFNNYTAVETYEPNIVKIRETCPNVNIVTKWTDIPRMKYKFIFVDSKEGAGLTGRWVREKPLMYALDNNLVDDNATIVMHDYLRVHQGINGKPAWRKRLNGWITMVEQYQLKLIHTIKIGRWWGVYNLPTKIT